MEIRNLRVFGFPCPRAPRKRRRTALPSKPPQAERADQPAEGFRRRRTHQTTPPITTATARTPKAIQPQGVSLLVVSAFFDATAAPAAAAAPGLRPLVVVCAVVVAGGTGAAAVVVAVVVETTVAVWTCVVVTVVGGAVTVTATVVGTRVVVAVVGGVVTVSGAVVVAPVVVPLAVVRLESDESAVETAAWFPPPQEVTANATASPATAATTYLTPPT